MQTGARYMAVFEVLSKVFEWQSPADEILNAYLRERKYIGSSDRRFITEKVWDIIRHKMRLEFEAGEENLRKMLLVYLKDENLAEIFSGEKYCLEALTAEEKTWLNSLAEEVYPPYVEAECPQWLFAKIENVELLKSLNTKASADFRINVRDRDSLLESLKLEGFAFEKTPYSSIGIRSMERVNLQNCIAHKEGKLEVQDEASQLVCQLFDVKLSHKIMDYCCGAGGKTLTLSYLMGNQGTIFAHDISKERLNAIKPRLERLAVRNVELISGEVKESNFDRFIVDAPCSGSGTWRRSPDAKYRLLPQKLINIINEQRSILDIAYEKTKIGGRIIYITCSVLKEENEEQIAEFMQKYPAVKLLNLKDLWNEKMAATYPCQNEKFLCLSPLTSGTDGFFCAILEKEA